jgi:hypothetical protein
VTIARDFELSAIKLNNDKVEVVPTVSQSPPSNLITQLTSISYRFDHAFSDQNNLVSSVITRLEK